jgi:hypothetical protein
VLPLARLQSPRTCLVALGDGGLNRLGRGGVPAVEEGQLVCQGRPADDDIIRLRMPLAPVAQSRSTGDALAGYPGQQTGTTRAEAASDQWSAPIGGRGLMLYAVVHEPATVIVLRLIAIQCGNRQGASR